MSYGKIHIVINQQWKKPGEKFDGIDYHIDITDQLIDIRGTFKSNMSINSMFIAMDITGYNIIHMPTVQNTKDGLVFRDDEYHSVVFEKEDFFYLFKIKGFINIKEKYLRLCSKVYGNFICIGFFSSFKIDNALTYFYYQNDQLVVDITKDSSLSIEIKIFKSSSLLQCILEAGLLSKNYEIKYEPYENKKSGLLKTLESEYYLKKDLAKKYNISFILPSKVLKIFDFYYVLGSQNYKFKYTGSVQKTSMYYLNLLNQHNLTQEEIFKVANEIKNYINNGNLYFNFYHNNIMLTEYKTYYHLPYLILLYLHICSFLNTEPLKDTERILNEIQYSVVVPYKFFSDDTLTAFDEYAKRFDNLLYAQETKTIYVCYKLFKIAFRYYENLEYQKLSENLKALLLLNYNFKKGYFCKNNYSEQEEFSLKLFERKGLK